METIKSFQVNHEKLEPGIYESMVIETESKRIVTFDLRFTRPNLEKPVSPSAIHTIEHLGATYLRTILPKNGYIHEDQIIYFGPMGCRTGFYLIMDGLWTSNSVLPLVKRMCNFIINYKGEIPGAKPSECGNYLEHNLEGAKDATKKFLFELVDDFRCEYPE